MKFVILFALMISLSIGTSSPMMDETYGTELYQFPVTEGSNVQTSVSEPWTSVVAEKAAESPELPAASHEADNEGMLESVGGISLKDTRNSVISKLGEPKSIEQDELWSELVIYHYPTLEITFYEEQLQYVDVPLAEEILIDDVTIPMSEEALRSHFGEPDFISEDGIVFQREEAVLKLFKESETNEPIYVSYYHITTV